MIWLLLACGGPSEDGKGGAADDTAAPTVSTAEPVDSGTTVTDPTPCVPGPGPRLVRRLTHAEYGAAVRDLLAVDLRPEDGFSADVTEDGFAGEASLAVSSLLAEQYRAAAEELAAAVDLDTLLSCGRADRACADTFIGTFGRRAYRRPLTVDERGTLIGLYDAVADDDGFDEGIRWVLTAMLQAPGFLYRSEVGARTAGEVFTLSDWELATALSFGVLGAPPDDALLDAAAGGRLGSADGVQAELDRLLADPRAADRVHDGVVAQLQLDRLPTVVRDGVAYPALTTEVRLAMAEETRRVVVEVASEGGGFADLLRTDRTWLTPDLAAYYGVDGPESPDADGWGQVTVSAERSGGLLAHGSLLTTHALPTTSSPIHRGVLVRERLLCQHLPPPPADLDISPPPVDPSLSTRERYSAHSDVPACAGCHDLIDPIGFGFEHFDGAGVYREVDGVHPVDASGEVVGSATSDGLYVGVGELAALVAEDAQACWVERGSRRLTGLELPECDVELFADATEGAGGRLVDLWRGWVALPHFRERVGGPDERDGPLGGGGWTPPDPVLDGDTGDTGAAPVGVVVEQTVQTDWGAGFCMDVVVTNHTADPVVWAVEIEVDGLLSSSWSSVWSDLGGGLFRVEGEGWNAELPPGGEAAFGYCATR
ncbi:MAG: hypothetical protein ACI9K2_001206 [Myxococcota bacterium]|jgi:hypothetical protein